MKIYEIVFGQEPKELDFGGIGVLGWIFGERRSIKLGGRTFIMVGALYLKRESRSIPVRGLGPEIHPVFENGQRKFFKRCPREDPSKCLFLIRGDYNRISYASKNLKIIAQAERDGQKGVIFGIMNYPAFFALLHYPHGFYNDSVEAAIL